MGDGHQVPDLPSPLGTMLTSDESHTCYRVCDIYKQTRTTTLNYTFSRQNITYELEGRSDHYGYVKSVVPWIGHTTSTKVDKPKVPMTKFSPGLGNLMKLLTIRVFAVSLGNSALEMVDNVISTLFPHQSLVNLICPQRGSGSLCHRLPVGSLSKTVMPNIRPNLLRLYNKSYDSNQRAHGDLMITPTKAHGDLMITQSLLPPDTVSTGS